MASLDIDLRSFGNTCFMEPPLMSISVENLVDFFFLKKSSVSFFFFFFLVAYVSNKY